MCPACARVLVVIPWRVGLKSGRSAVRPRAVASASTRSPDPNCQLGNWLVTCALTVSQLLSPCDDHVVSVVDIRVVLRALAEVRDKDFYALWALLTRSWPKPLPGIEFRIYQDRELESGDIPDIRPGQCPRSLTTFSQFRSWPGTRAWPVALGLLACHGPMVPG